jgi:hypothetical protein
MKSDFHIGQMAYSLSSLLQEFRGWMGGWVGEDLLFTQHLYSTKGNVFAWSDPDSAWFGLILPDGFARPLEFGLAVQAYSGGLRPRRIVRPAAMSISDIRKGFVFIQHLYVAMLHLAARRFERCRESEAIILVRLKLYVLRTVSLLGFLGKANRGFPAFWLLLFLPSGGLRLG